MSTSLKRISAFCFVAILLFISVYTNIYKLTSLVVNRELTTSTDFVSYYTSGRLVANGEFKNLYDLNIQNKYYKEVADNGSYPFRALPIVSFIFYPLALLSFHQAYIIFLIINLLIIGTVLVILDKLRYAPLLFSFSPLVFSLAHGQTVLFVILGMGITYLLLKHNKIFLAGMAFSLCLIKLQFIICLPFILLAVTKKLRFIYGLILMIVLTNIPTVLVVDGIAGYIKTLTQTESIEHGTFPKIIVSLQYFIQNAGLGSKEIAIIVSLVVFIFLWINAYTKRKDLSIKETYAVACTTSVVFGYHVHIHDLAILLIPGLLLMDDPRYNRLLIALFVLLTTTYKYTPTYVAPLLILAILYILNYKYFNEKNRRDTQEQKQIS